MITYNPDGGDLGRAAIKPITALEMQIVIPHVANILEELAVLQIGELPFKYAFELHIDERQAGMYVIHVSTYKLPPHVFWYTIDGNYLFEMRGASGGIATGVVCYLITRNK